MSNFGAKEDVQEWRMDLDGEGLSGILTDTGGA
jgi:hypothetical protein